MGVEGDLTYECGSRGYLAAQHGFVFIPLEERMMMVRVQSIDWIEFFNGRGEMGPSVIFHMRDQQKIRMDDVSIDEVLALLHEMERVQEDR